MNQSKNIVLLLTHSGDYFTVDRVAEALLSSQAKKFGQSWQQNLSGKKVFAAAIDSQQLAKARYDWRVEGIALCDKWFIYQLPIEIEKKLLALIDYFSKNYGAIDLILTPEDDYVFLEINPVGEFLWLERYPGFPLSEAIADLLFAGDVQI